LGSAAHIHLEDATARSVASPGASVGAGRRAGAEEIALTSAVASAVLALAALAWVTSAGRMQGMDAGPGTDPGAIASYLPTVALMMAAMMLPPLAPTLAVVAGAGARSRARSLAPLAAAATFALGYLAAWSLAGLLVYGLLEAGRALDGGVLAWGHGGRWVAAAVILTAAAYQLTPAKKACLARCRDAHAMLTAERKGRGGLRSGIQHGVWCIGCCWALMAALFALGAMSLVWMALVTILIACERLLPWRLATMSVAAALLAALAIGLAAAPSQVPGLTVPGASKTMSLSAPR
jgi:predicted metal-binding membrane protein